MQFFLQRNWFSSFFWIITIAFGLSVLFIDVFFRLGGMRAVILATGIYAQIHFIISYLFAFHNLKRWLQNSFLGAFFSYLLLIGGTFYFYRELVLFISAFWGFMAVAGFFLLHFYENTIFFSETTAPQRPVLPSVERTALYFLLAAFSALLYLFYAPSYGQRFASVKIIFSGIDTWMLAAAAGVVLFLAAFIFIRGANHALLAKIVIPYLAAISVLFFIGSYFLSFFGIVYFITVWHFFMWHVFYVWKLWKRHPTFSPMPVSHKDLPEGTLAGTLAYGTSGPVPFLILSGIVAIFLVGYFISDYRATTQAFFYNPVYGQFSMFVWSIPHIALSFLPLRNMSVRA